MPRKINSHNTMYLEWSNRMSRRSYKIHNEFNNMYNASYGDYEGDKSLAPHELDNVQYNNRFQPSYVFKKATDKW